jgi:hypothetical protein
LGIERKQTFGILWIVTRGGLPVDEAAHPVNFADGIEIRNKLAPTSKGLEDFDLKISPRTTDTNTIVLRESLEQIDSDVLTKISTRSRLLPSGPGRKPWLRGFLLKVLGNVAIDAGLVAMVENDTTDIQAGKLPSRWVVMARNKDDLGKLIGDLRWNSLKGDPRSRVWTDDYSSILTVFIWD